MNQVLARWNSLDIGAAVREVLPCNGSRAWAAGLSALRPFMEEPTLLNASAGVWFALPQSDWQEAFDSHPRIGQNHAQSSATEESLRLSAHEQSSVEHQDKAVKLALQKANHRYEHRFGRIFVVCASGKTSAEILDILERRMQNDNPTELREAAEQQRQITQLRLQRWLRSE